jgi:hypothetical protein
MRGEEKRDRQLTPHLSLQGSFFPRERTRSRRSLLESVLNAQADRVRFEIRFEAGQGLAVTIGGGYTFRTSRPESRDRSVFLRFFQYDPRIGVLSRAGAIRIRFQLFVVLARLSCSTALSEPALPGAHFRAADVPWMTTRSAQLVIRIDRSSQKPRDMCT